MQAIMISELSMRKPQTLIQRIFRAGAPKVSISIIIAVICIPERFIATPSRY